MKLAFLDKQNALYFFPFDEQEKSSLTIPAIEGGRYIFTEQQSALLAEAVTAQRLDNDLHLRLYTDPQQPVDIVLKDFYLGDNSLYSLTGSGEYHQHLVARSDDAQGAVEWISTSLGHQQDQAESAFLNVIQRAANFEALEQQLEVLNANNVAPVAQQDAPLVGPRLMSASAFTVYPEITAIHDNAGSATGPIQLNAQQGIAIIDDRQPVFEGSGEPNATLEILHGGEPILTVKVDAQGHWSIQLEDALGEGAQFFSVRDVATGQVSDSVALIIDTIAPQRATITQVIQDHTGTASAVSNGGYTADNTPMLTGKAEASSLVTIYNGDVELGATIANAQGVWRFTRVNPPLPDGEYVFKVVAQDASGNVSLPSQVYKVIIDTMAPEQPQIVEVLDDVGSATGPLLHGAITDDTAPTLKGKAEAHSTVKIFDRGSQIGSVTADAAGNWTFTPAQPLAEGVHSFTVTATDRAGYVSAPSSSWDLTVKLTPPSMPIITAVKDDVGSIQGVLQKNASTDDTRPTIEGTSEARSTISIYSNGTLLGTVVADAVGHWSFTPPAALADGLHNLTAVATNATGSSSEPTAIYPITIDTAIDRPKILHGADHEGSSPYQFFNGAVIEHSSPLVSIRGPIGSTVVLYDHGVEVARQSLQDSIWGEAYGYAVIRVDLVDGFHDLTVVAIDPAGNVSQLSDSFTFTVDTGVHPVTVSITSVSDDVGAITGAISKGGVSDDNKPTLAGKATASSIVKVYDGATLLGQTTADASGNWSFTPATALSDGLHNLTAVATNAAGSSSEPTAIYPITVDTVIDRPKILSGSDHEGSSPYEFLDGAVIYHPSPLISIRGPIGSTVVLYDKGVEVARQSLQDSIWGEAYGYAVIRVDLPEGFHDLTAVSIDPAGNVSLLSDSFTFTVDTAVHPVTVSITSVSDDVGAITGAISKGGVSDDNKPTLAGKATVSSIVKVYDGATLLGQTTADASGNWSFTPPAALANGLHNLTAVATNAAGIASEPTEIYPITIDTVVTRPSIGGAHDNEGPKQGAFNSGAFIDDLSPMISITGEHKNTVVIYDKGVEIARGTLDGQFWWGGDQGITYITLPLSQGFHDLTVVAIDAAGNVSQPSNHFAFTIQTGTPATSRMALFKDDVDSVQDNLEKVAEVVRGTDEDESSKVEQPKAEVKSNGADTLSISAADDHSPTLSLNDVLVEGQVDLLQNDGFDIVQAADNAGEVDAVKAESLQGMESFEENMSYEDSILVSDGEVFAIYQPVGLDAELLVQQGV
ncbi:Ig-like domain-containing protein [Pseudomonas sp. URMO17WK12:I11]|uniref:Ig-like domain-containing protein n=1 Tax=Pseudomonas sp. URMO17WK12:I11 TaxID=1283291 RepID=UPI000722831A|nr:Ig-like domain-containing protein [Pseudomonas sp. URMO17WK12:I11]CRL51646.1 hypothetical protein PSHI_48390 [Pseudomonas sp. URMO17WK12:I11]